MAKIIGAAPFNPTHDINSFSLKLLLNGARHKKTLAGRAINIITMEITMPGTMVGKSSFGDTKSPNVKNIISWQSHVRPSKKLIVARLCTKVELPMTSPPIYTAK